MTASNGMTRPLSSSHGVQRSGVLRPPAAVGASGSLVAHVVRHAERLEDHLSHVAGDPGRVAIEPVVHGAGVVDDVEAARGDEAHHLVHVDRQLGRVVGAGAVAGGELAERHLGHPTHVADAVIGPLAAAVRIQHLDQAQANRPTEPRLDGDRQGDAVVEHAGDEGTLAPARAARHADPAGIDDVGVLFQHVEDTADLPGLRREVTRRIVRAVIAEEGPILGAAAACRLDGGEGDLATPLGTGIPLKPP